jgi:hypothetical protein
MTINNIKVNLIIMATGLKAPLVSRDKERLERIKIINMLNILS